MKNLFSSTIFALAGLVMLSAPLHVQAQSFLDGRTLVFAFAYPSSTNGAGTSHLIGPGVEYTPGDISGPYWRLDVSDRTLEFTFARATTWTIPNTWSEPFTPGAGGTLLMNGLRMSDNNASVPDFASFQVLAETTLAGFASNRVRVTANTVLVDFAGLTSVVGDKVVLQLSPIPEPSAAAMLLMGLSAGFARSSRGSRPSRASGSCH